MAQNRPHRRTTGRSSNMASTTRQQAPVQVSGLHQSASLPEAPEPPIWSSNPLPISRGHPNSISSLSTRHPYHVTSPITPTSDNRSVGRRSPSPIPPTPGAPRITPLDDSDIEDEDKNLVGIDRGYLRLGGRQLRYIPSPPATPPPCERDHHDGEENGFALQKMNSQLEFALQYIKAQAQMGNHRRAPPSQDREGSSGTDDHQDVDHELQVYSRRGHSSRSRELSPQCTGRCHSERYFNSLSHCT